MPWTSEQIDTLRKLDAALADATTHGVLDQLQAYCGYPDSINDFCESVDDALKEGA